VVQSMRRHYLLPALPTLRHISSATESRTDESKRTKGYILLAALQESIQRHGSGYGDVERLFLPMHRNFNYRIRESEYFRFDTFDFAADDERGTFQGPIRMERY